MRCLIQKRQERGVRKFFQEAEVFVMKPEIARNKKHHDGGLMSQLGLPVPRGCAMNKRQLKKMLKRQLIFAKPENAAETTGPVVALEVEAIVERSEESIKTPERRLARPIKRAWQQETEGIYWESLP